MRFVSARLRPPATPRQVRLLRLRIQRFPYSRQAQASKRRLQSARQRILNNYLLQKRLPSRAAGFFRRIGDIIEITFGANTSKFEVLSVNEYATKENASLMFRQL